MGGLAAAGIAARVPPISPVAVPLVKYSTAIGIAGWAFESLDRIGVEINLPHVYGYDGTYYGVPVSFEHNLFIIFNEEFKK